MSVYMYEGGGGGERGGGGRIHTYGWRLAVTDFLPSYEVMGEKKRAIPRACARTHTHKQASAYAHTSECARARAHTHTRARATVHASLTFITLTFSLPVNVDTVSHQGTAHTQTTSTQREKIPENFLARGVQG